MKQKPIINILLCCLILFLLASFTAYGENVENNLLNNGSFEQLDSNGLPMDWYTEAYINQPGYTQYAVTQDARQGNAAAVVENLGANDARFAQYVSVEPNTIYRLHGYVKTEGILDSGLGANLSIGDVYVFSNSIYETHSQWQELEMYGKTGPDQRMIVVFARLGGYSGESIGKAWFDDVSLTKVTGIASDNGLVMNWFKPEVQEVADTQDEGEARPAWPLLLALSLCFAVLVSLMLPYLQKEANEKDLKQNAQAEAKTVSYLVLSLLAAFVLRVILAVIVPGYQVDINCFLSWGGTMFHSGPANFYADSGFSDYPPAYLYVLWLNGAFANWFGPLSTGMGLLNIKLVPILADITTAGLLYTIGKRKLPVKAAAALAILYAFNPAVIINGSAWGQVDSVLALGLMLVAIMAMDRKWDKALPIYMLCVLIKPQALMLGPLGLAAVVMDFFRGKEERPWRQVGFGILWSMLVAAVIIVPFSINQQSVGILGKTNWLYELYKKTLGSYPHTTVNTANLYYVASRNWQDVIDPARQSLVLLMALVTGGLALWQFATLTKRKGSLLDRFGLAVFMGIAAITFVVMAAIGVSYAEFGAAMMALVILWVLLAYVRGGSLKNLPLMGGILFIGLYVLGVKMHERYLFPALALLSLSYVYKRDWRILALLVGFTITTFVNTGIVLDNSIRLGSAMGHLNEDTKSLNILISLINLALCAFAFYTGEVLCACKGQVKQILIRDKWLGTAPQAYESSAKTALLKPRDARLNLKKLDYLILTGVTLVYAVVAFWNLGSMKAPQTAWISTGAGEQVVLDIGQETDFKLLYYGGINYNDFVVSTSADGINWSEEYNARMKEGNCFQWQYVVLSTMADGKVTYGSTVRDMTGRYVRITAPSIGLNLSEVLVRTLDGQTLPVTITEHTGANASSNLNNPPQNLIDEQDTLDGEPGWFNGTYFDEIYHARTAYEHANNIRPYETSHPPLGKVMMSWAVMAFGMTPFGWRFAGAFVGVLMLPAMYLMAKQLLKRTDLSAAAMLLMAFDLMHFTQTRIATIDSFPVLFIILSYLCMFRYMQTDIWGTPFYKTLIPLALSGLFMGLGMASKWVGIYAGAGLAVLFFYSGARHLVESREARKLMKNARNLPEDRRQAIEAAAEKGFSRVFETCLSCLIFFVAVPGIIYYLSYIPYFAPGGGITLQKLIEAQKNMLSYHGTPGLGADHPFQSPWWEWPLILKPMWYFKGDYVLQGMGSTIYAMGNPAVWWAGLTALFIVFLVFVKRHVWQDASHRMLHAHTREHDMIPAMLLIGFASQYMPWVLVPRSTFIYHYFASVPFIIMCTVLCFDWLGKVHGKLAQRLMWGLVGVAAVLFIVYYPYASGVETPLAWFENVNWITTLYH